MAACRLPTLIQLQESWERSRLRGVAHGSAGLSRSFPAAAALALPGSESRLTAAPLLTAAGSSGRTLPREPRAALRAIAVAASVSVPDVAMRLHPLVTAEGTVATLTNRELRSAAFLFLSFDARQLRANQRAVNRAFLDLGLRLVLFFVTLVFGNRRRRFFFLIDYWRRRHVNRSGSHDRLLLFDNYGRIEVSGFGVGSNVWTLDVRLAGKDFFVEGGGRFFLPPLRNLAAFVRVLGIARRASSLFDVFLDHRDDGMVREPSLARTVVVQYVTETQPALLHSVPPRITVYGWKKDPLAVLSV